MTLPAEIEQGVNRTELACSFCRELSGDPDQEFTRIYGAFLASRVIWRTDSFAVMPSIGQLVPGYLLIVPVDHVKSFGSLGEPQRREADELIRRVQRALKLTFGGPLMFEHGHQPTSKDPGCGVVHAHMHVVPVAAECKTVPEVPGAHWADFDHDGALDGLARMCASGHDYVFFENRSGQRSIAAVDRVPSQLFRQWFGKQVANSNWDWRCAGFEETLLTTIKRLRGMALT